MEFFKGCMFDENRKNINLCLFYGCQIEFLNKRKIKRGKFIFPPGTMHQKPDEACKKWVIKVQFLIKSNNSKLSSITVNNGRLCLPMKN